MSFNFSVSIVHANKVKIAVPRKKTAIRYVPSLTTSLTTYVPSLITSLTTYVPSLTTSLTTYVPSMLP